jgi:murein DD-endopeptidase MepM/ murein hydrolase activator NlpD
MAVAVKPSNSLINIRSSIKSVRSAFSGLKKKTGNLNNILLRKTKVKRESIARNYILSQRRHESERRKNREDLIEASSVGGAFKRQAKAVASSTKGFLGRIMDFLGTLLIGWLTYNLPSIITMAQDLIGRIQKTINILGNFMRDIGGIFSGSTKVLGAVFTNITSLDFFDSHKRLSTALGELEGVFTDMNKQFDDGIKLLTTPLGQMEGEQTPAPPGTKYENESFQPSGTSGGQTYESTGGQKIKKSEFGRGFKVKDNLGSGKSAFGHTGQDVPMASGTPLSIVATGVVIEASTGYNGGYGNFVAIRLDDGRYIKINHLSKILVKQGDKVGAGTGANGGVRVIGLVGSSGLSTGSHMHIDVGTGYNRGPANITGLMNPSEFILSGGIVRGGDVKSTGKVNQTSTGPKPPVAQPQNSLMEQSTPSGGTLSTPQLVALAKQAGMTKNVNVSGYSGPLDVLMGAVAMQESRGKSDSMRSDTQVYGLWQIQWPTHAPNLRKIGITSPEQLKNPLINAKAAKMVYDSQGITAWSGFTDGRYKQFLPAAKKAAGIAPSQYSPSQIKPQIASQGTQQRQQVSQQLAQQRNGPTVVVIEEDPPAQQQVSAGGGGGGGMMPIIINPLNSFITQKLLLDLAYT